MIIGCKFYPYCKQANRLNELCRYNYIYCLIYKRLNITNNPKPIDISILFNRKNKMSNTSIIRNILILGIGLRLLDLLVPKTIDYCLSLSKMNENRFIVRMSKIIFSLILIINLLFLI